MIWSRPALRSIMFYCHRPSPFKVQPRSSVPILTSILMLRSSPALRSICPDSDIDLNAPVKPSSPIHHGLMPSTVAFPGPVQLLCPNSAMDSTDLVTPGSSFDHVLLPSAIAFQSPAQPRSPVPILTSILMLLSMPSFDPVVDRRLSSSSPDLLSRF